MQWPTNIVLIGAGKLAKALGHRLHETGHKVGVVWSRSAHSAQLLANDLECSWTNELFDLPERADLYLVLVPDHAISSLLPQLIQALDPNSLVMHTSGATPANVLGDFKRHGVFYPLQTFSPGRAIHFTEVPLCLNTSLATDYPLVEQLARRLSEKVYPVSDEQRLRLHLAAIFVNNFTNYMQHIAQEIIQAHDLPGNLLLPLLKETIDKLEELSPREAQTGPAVRRDYPTLKRHEALLQNQKQWQRLYRLLSTGIEHDLGSSSG